MASLMPLQKSITPWKVESREFWGGSIQSPHQEGKARGRSPYGTERVAVRQEPPGQEVDPVSARHPAQGREALTELLRDCPGICPKQGGVTIFS